jgi:hypothetical protein
MKSVSWKTVAELTGITAIVASLVFVGFQIRQEQSIAVAQLRAQHMDSQIEWSRLIAENNEIWVRGLSGEDLEDGEKAVFRTLANSYFTIQSVTYTRLRDGWINIDPTGVAYETAHNLASYPGLNAAFEELWNFRNQYSQSTTTYVQQVRTRLQEIERGDIPHIDNDSFAPN